jgi:hypothetical protein
MINLLVSESYAFDYLSILEIKKDKFQEQEKHYKECYLFLSKQIGHVKFSSILKSQEYLSLKETNLLIFNGVDKAKFNLITAKELDNYNILRYRAKQVLQKKFFHNSISEFKT